MAKINRDRRAFLTATAAQGAVLLLTPGILLAQTCRPVTPAQTEGPFYPKAFLSAETDLTAKGRAQGVIHIVKGRVVDSDCRGLAGVQVDLWQANVHGRYRHRRDQSNPAPLDPAFQGMGRVLTDKDGGFTFRTIKPGSYPAGRGWMRPPHLHFKVWREGQPVITTQMYFAGDPLNDKDLILQGLSDAGQDNVVVGFSHGKTEFSGFFQIRIEA